MTILIPSLTIVRADVFSVYTIIATSWSTRSYIWGCGLEANSRRNIRGRCSKIRVRRGMRKSQNRVTGELASSPNEPPHTPKPEPHNGITSTTPTSRKYQRWEMASVHNKMSETDFTPNVNEIRLPSSPLITDAALPPTSPRAALTRRTLLPGSSTETCPAAM